MTLLALPTELRLRIYDFIPDLQPTHHEEVTIYSRLTPPICRTSQVLRHETLPIFASQSHFSIRLDNSPPTWSRRLAAWVQALDRAPGGRGLSRVRSISMSHHWKIPKPTQGLGHVGLYIKVERRESTAGTDAVPAASRNPSDQISGSVGLWIVNAGTYPVAKDAATWWRWQSVVVFERFIRQYFLHSRSDVAGGLVGDDVQLLLRALDVVSSHPFALRESETREISFRIRAQDSMEADLKALIQRKDVTAL